MEDNETEDAVDKTLDLSKYAFGNLYNSINSTAYTGAAPSSMYINTGGASLTSNYNYTVPSTSYHNGIIVNGGADFKGDIKINGKSIVDTINAIEKRLSILTPNPKKLAKYEALQKAYEHYKAMEALCHGDDNE